MTDADPAKLRELIALEIDLETNDWIASAIAGLKSAAARIESADARIAEVERQLAERTIRVVGDGVADDSDGLRLAEALRAYDAEVIGRRDEVQRAHAELGRTRAQLSAAESALAGKSAVLEVAEREWDRLTAECKAAEAARDGARKARDDLERWWKDCQSERDTLLVQVKSAEAARQEAERTIVEISGRLCRCEVDGPMCEHGLAVDYLEKHPAYDPTADAFLNAEAKR